MYFREVLKTATDPDPGIRKSHHDSEIRIIWKFHSSNSNINNFVFFKETMDFF